MSRPRPQKVHRVCRNPDCPSRDASSPLELLECSRCQQACYCGKWCQRAHWKTHKPECRAVVIEGARLSANLDGSTIEQWSHPGMENALLDQWAATMPNELQVPGCSARATIDKMGLRPIHFQGTTMGDWGKVVRGLNEEGAKVSLSKSQRKLRPGDRVQILPGNHVKREVVGQTAVLVEYFRSSQKWGMEFDQSHMAPAMILAANLKLIE